jgi:hypothetical protein
VHDHCEFSHLIFEGNEYNRKTRKTWLRGEKIDSTSDQAFIVMLMSSNGGGNSHKII